MPTKEAPRSKEVVKVGREDFLSMLDKVSPGLSKREIVEQSSCFAFKAGSLMTFNEEIACRTKSGLPKQFKGAVQAEPLLNILRKSPDKQISIRFTPRRMVIVGKNRETGITLEKQILLPISTVEDPGDWKPMHEDFTDAVNIVQECASKDQSAFTFTCVHIHPEYMEACDNLQLTRYDLPTEIKRPFLVRRDSIKHVPSFDFTEFSVTRNWIHFKDGEGMIMSCHKYSEKFEDLGHLLNAKGIPTVLPPTLGDAAERCQLFSKENASDNLVLIELRAGKLRIRGEGNNGYHKEKKTLKYDGQPMAFRISPSLLMELVKRNTDCRISRKHRLLVDGGKFKYAACLQRV